ncbi:CaiB/BaiF CoA transferase family protein [Kordiimonas sp.]|uniref:CaiB/BaiF CoA transferase family protein n=1 Tax=Kordiimonas sp. TaxID=1970157 RepID=UPI003A9212C3
MQDIHGGRQLPLAGVRVLDFGRYIAGPYCAALFADFGAEVIRVEKRSGSEDRHVTPVSEKGAGALFLQMNRNKRSIAIDPKSKGGRDIVRKLVATADIVVANLPGPTLKKMGLSYEQLCEVNAGIILTTVSTFGDHGEWSDRVGFDSIAQAMSGAAYLSGDETPSRSQASWVDFGTALHCAFGTVVALMERNRTGKGQKVSGNLLSTAMTMMNAQQIEQDLIAPNRPPLGNAAAGAAPIGTFRARDGWISCHVVGQPIFERLALALGREDWLKDPRFVSDPTRGENRESLLAYMGNWCAERTRDEILDLFAEARIPAGPVLTPQEALDHPQTSALGLLQSVEYGDLHKPAKIARAPVWLSAHEAELRSPPQLGEDTENILSSLGFSSADMEELRRGGAI